MIAFAAKTVNPLHPGVTVQQNDDKVESAPRAFTFGKIGQHRWVAKLLMDWGAANRDECPNSNRCAAYDLDQEERYGIRKSNILGKLIALGSRNLVSRGFRP